MTLDRSEPGDNVLTIRAWAPSSGPRHNGCAVVPTPGDRLDTRDRRPGWVASRTMSSVTNLARNLTDTTRAHAGRVAVRVDDAALTYRALDEASARVAGLLRERGLKPGDRVGLMMPNVAEVPVVYYGVLRAGGVVVPMNPLLKGREVAYYLSDSGAGLMFAWHAFAGEARGGAGQAAAEAIVVDPGSFPDLLASVDPDY